MKQSGFADYTFGQNTARLQVGGGRKQSLSYRNKKKTTSMQFTTIQKSTGSG